MGLEGFYESFELLIHLRRMKATSGLPYRRSRRLAVVRIDKTLVSRDFLDRPCPKIRYSIEIRPIAEVEGES